MAEKPERAILDPLALREFWTRTQRLRDDVAQMATTLDAMPGAGARAAVGAVVAENVYRLMAAATGLAARAAELYGSVVAHLDDYSLAMPPKKGALGFAASSDSA